MRLFNVTVEVNEVRLYEVMAATPEDAMAGAEQLASDGEPPVQVITDVTVVDASPADERVRPEELEGKEEPPWLDDPGLFDYDDDDEDPDDVAKGE